MPSNPIGWCEETWNPICLADREKKSFGCTKVSPGCLNCYASTMNHRFGGPLYDYQRTDFKFRIHPCIADPLRWRKPRVVFICSMMDLFHEAVPFEMIDEVFAVFDQCKTHTFLVLTKRPQRMAEYVHQGEPGVFPYSNVWLGVTAENREMWDERVPVLKSIPAAKHYISYEPALGDLGQVDLDGLDWIICGGESGHGARPMHPDWPRSLRDQCVDAGVPFWFKQWGPNKKAGHLLDGVEWRQRPEVDYQCDYKCGV